MSIKRPVCYSVSAGLILMMCFMIISMAKAQTQQPQFVGIIINNNDLGTHIAFEVNNDWYIPAAVLASALNISQTKTDNILTLNTPAGDFQINPNQYFTDGGDTYIAQSALINQAKFDITFNQQDYALVLYPPWGNGITNNIETPDADFSPSATRLNTVSIETNLEQLADEIRKRHTVEARGAAADGLWHLAYEKPDQQDDYLREYYYVKGSAQQQTFLGFDNVSTSTLINAAPFSGIQHVYSNQRISPDQKRRINIDDFYNSIGGAHRRISGISEPGAIAILRVNGMNISQTRTNLDGRFSFSNVRLNNNDFNDIEVIIRNRAGTAIIERIDYSMRTQARLLDDGQNIIYGAIGQRGNITRENSTAAQEAFSGALLYRHGISDTFTLEGSTFDNGLNHYNTIGLHAAIGKHSNQTATVAQNDQSLAYEISNYSSGEKWHSSLRLRQYDSAFRDNIKDNHIYQGDFTVRTLENEKTRLDLSLIASSQQTDTRNDEYVLPALAFYTQQNELSVSPDREGDYQIRASHANDKFRARYDAEPKENTHSLSLNYQHNNKISSFYNVNYTGEKHDDLYETGINWMPLPRQYLDASLRLSALSDGESNPGYNVQFDNTIIPGVNISLYARQAPQAQALSDNTFYGLDMRIDLAYRNRRLVASDITPNINLNDGAIAGRIISSNQKAANQLTQGAIKINGVNRDITLHKGNYYVNHVPVGMHRVRLAHKNLPIEMTPASDEYYWAKVSPGNVTNINFNIELRLGFAGRVRLNNTSASQATIEIYNQDNDLVFETSTDQFGLYRADNLKTGQYTVIARKDNCHGQRQSELSREYIFEQNIELICD